MEEFFSFIGIIAIWVSLFYLGSIIRGFFSAGKAAVDTARGKGTFIENFNFEMKGMGHLELRGVKKTLGDQNDGFAVIELEVKGLFPIGGILDAVFITSVLDVTDEVPHAVVAMLNSFQEPVTTCFQFAQETGLLKEGHGFRDWARIGFIPLGILQPPRRGLRRLRAYVILADKRDVPEIAHGFYDQEEQEKLYWSGTFNFQIDFDQPGWKDEAEGDRTAACAMLKLGVAMAMSDGEFADDEGEILKSWIEVRISNYEGASRESWRTDLNNALKEGYEGVLAGTLSLSDLTELLKKTGSQSARYACIDLLYEVLAADGVADPEEISMVKNIAAALEIDEDELRRIADQKLVGLSARIETDDDLEKLLDINPEWNNEQTKRHLRDQFQKWNNRMNTLSDLDEKANAQRMLSLIAEARKKYE